MRFAVCALLAATALFAQEQPVAWSWRDKAPNKPFKAGAQLNVRVAADIKPGWHLYSLIQKEGGPIATTLKLPEGVFEVTGLAKAPKPTTVMDPNFQMQVGYYEGKVNFELPVSIKKSTKPGKYNLEVNARYQACDDKQCLPPRTVKLEMPVEVR